jgi:hypothetical protein
MPGPSIASVTFVAPDVVHFNSIMVGALQLTGSDAPTVVKPEIFTDDVVFDGTVVVGAGATVVELEAVLVAVDVLVAAVDVVVVAVEVLCFELLLQALRRRAAAATTTRTRICAS